MSKRTSPQQIQDIEDLNDLEHLVKDKRQQQRVKAKKMRRNRHYTRLLIKQGLQQARWKEA